MEIDITIVTAITSATIGATLGFLVKTHFVNKEFRQKIQASVVAEYLSTRDEICEKVAECAAKASYESDDWIKKIAQSISVTYFKNQGYMPIASFKELICLQACLDDEQHRLFCLKDNEIALLDSEELEDFCRGISVVDNLHYGLYWNLRNANDDTVKKTRVEYQARHALKNINKHFTVHNLASLSVYKKNKSNLTKLLKAG